VLGAAQWAWLETELARPADLRIVVSSIQVLAEGHGWERWGNLPNERERLIGLIASVKEPIVVLSGDRHTGAIYAQGAGDREIVEVTSSSLNMPIPKPNLDARIPPLVSEILQSENFGMMSIDWERRNVSLELRDAQGVRLAGRQVPF
jgi:alkaline phosphatase D